MARLAAGSTWFRNASSLHPLTKVSVPSILTGTVGEKDDLPTWHDHPRSYLTLFGDRYPINAYEAVTDMLPPRLGGDDVRGALSTALRDGSIVYGHQVLPGELAGELPSIDHSWGGFDDDLGDLAVGQPSDFSWTADDRPLFGSLPTAEGRVPYLLTGSVLADGSDEPPEMLVAVNGTVAGSMGGYSESDGGSRRYFALLGPYFVAGANTVEAYEVECTPLGPVLHRMADA